MGFPELGNLKTITPAILEALGASFKTIIEHQAQPENVWWKPFVYDIPATDLVVMLKMLTDPIKLREWVDYRKAQNIAKRFRAITLSPLECTVGIDRGDILYGSMRAQLPQVLSGINKVEGEYIAEEILKLLENGQAVSEIYFTLDDKPIFSATHPIEKKFVSGGVQVNYYADLDLTGANATAVETAMKALKGDNGRRMGVKPDYLWFSPNLKATARGIFDKANLANGESNIYDKQFQLIEAEGLDTDNLWGLLDSRFLFKPFAFLHAIKTSPRWLQEPGEKFKEGLYGYDEDAKLAPYSWYAITKCVHTP
ncbi:Mu-like prophage major head subunit gpT family protein [Zavarzinia sp.]|uniref:Mu-like prophage major head subunit gpT family protein n=1 Tax=Zavarzinia sp. TaxID=2027920 RepID=UPI0035630BF6